VLEALYRKVEEFFARARAAQPGAYACGEGCHRCCHSDLTIFAVEAERLAAAFASLPPRSREAAARRAKRGEHCAMLHPRTHRCIVYAARPLICRSFGLASLFEGEITWCPVNFEDAAPRAEHVLDLSRINEPLCLIERLAAKGERRRVRIADVARGQ